MNGGSHFLIGDKTGNFSHYYASLDGVLLVFIGSNEDVPYRHSLANEHGDLFAKLKAAERQQVSGRFSSCKIVHKTYSATSTKFPSGSCK